MQLAHKSARRNGRTSGRCVARFKELKATASRISFNEALLKSPRLRAIAQAIENENEALKEKEASASQSGESPSNPDDSSNTSNDDVSKTAHS